MWFYVLPNGTEQELQATLLRPLWTLSFVVLTIRPAATLSNSQNAQDLHASRPTETLQEPPTTHPPHGTAQH